jgi:hypothetical protein
MLSCCEDRNERGFHKMQGISCLAEPLLGFQWRRKAMMSAMSGGVFGASRV